MLDGLEPRKQGQQFRLVCPNHPNTRLWQGALKIGDSPVQFVKHCGEDYCNNLAYAETEAALNAEVQTEGQKLP